MKPLAGIRVLDFSTRLPGLLATRILAEAGAEVIKIERPGRASAPTASISRWVSTLPIESGVAAPI